MQQPPDQYSQYPEQQWPLPPQPLPPQQQTNYGQPQSFYPPSPIPQQQQWNPQQPLFSQQQYPKQQWYHPDYTRLPIYDSLQQPPIQRPKRNRVMLWVSVSIIGAILAILVVVSSVLIGYSLFFSSNHSFETIFTSTQYPTLHTEYAGTITDPSFTSNASAPTSPMALLITSNDNQGNISGRVGILLAPNGGDPFIGTLGVAKTITFTATPLLIGVLTVFTGKINSDGSISGTARNIFLPQFWKLSPVKGK